MGELKRMKFFSESDGVLDIIAKLVTSVGVIFGAWAYFNTIHPVFEKEIELQNLRLESQNLSATVRELNNSVKSLGQDKATLEINIASLNEHQGRLKSEIGESEKQLKSAIASLRNASDSAVLNKLQYYSDKLTSAYLLAVTANKRDEFDVLEYSKKILATHAPDADDEYGKQAYEYFKSYVEFHGGRELKGDRVVEFAVSLFFNYKIDLLKKRASEATFEVRE
jgi:hypothetical protein